MKNYFTLLLFLLLAGFSQAQQRTTVGRTDSDPYSTGLFRSHDGIWFNLEDEPSVSGYLNILDWLQGRVAGLQVYTLRNGSRIALIRNRPAAVFIDEMRTDFSFLEMLPVSDIAAIKIIKQPSALGTSGGIIAVYTKGGEDSEEDPEETEK